MSSRFLTNRRAFCFVQDPLGGSGIGELAAQKK